MGPGVAPLVLVEDAHAHAAARAEIIGAGWPVVGRPNPAPGEVWESAVADRQGVLAAVLAAARGCGLLVTASSELAAELAEDLRGVGVVHYREDWEPALDASSWAMLHAVAGGQTVETAAHSLHLSLRTGQRRLAEAQRGLGGPSLAAAVARLGSAQRIRPRRGESPTG